MLIPPDTGKEPRDGKPRTAFGRMHPLFLTFGKRSAEQRFRESWAKAATPTSRLWSLSAILAYCLMTAALFRLDPEFATEQQWFRWLVCFPLLLIELAMSQSLVRRPRLAAGVFLAASLACFLNAAISYAFAPSSLKIFFLLEQAMLFVFCASYFRTLFTLTATFTGIATLIAMPVIVLPLVTRDAPVTEIGAELFIIGCLAATLILSVYYREILVRRNFRAIMTARSEEAKAEELAREALAHSRAKSDFLAAVGEELSLAVRHVMDQSQTEAAGREWRKGGGYLSEIHEGAARLQTTVQRIVHVSRGAEAFPIDGRGRAPVLDILKERIGIWAAGEDTPAPLCDAQDTPPEAAIPVADLKQILDECLSNIVKHGGGLRGAHASIDLSDTHRLRLRIADTGPGLPDSVLETVFDPFFQMDDCLGRSQEGLGLGLTRARQLARASHGDLWLETAGASGLTAVLELPLADEPHEDKPKRADARFAALTGE